MTEGLRYSELFPCHSERCEESTNANQTPVILSLLASLKMDSSLRFASLRMTEGIR
ncbi:MAG: hypothetical protein NZM06_04885 [Chloroherpetonaceae bacterium]|nr:hypothetical protein [Chloroherpetonaceae bacterium]